MEIKRLGDVARDAFKELKKLQTGERLLPKTGEEFIDSHINCILPGDVILISALSGQGKTETLQRMKRKILSKEVNPHADNYVFLDVSLEMKVFNLVLRAVANKTKKLKAKIISEEFTEEEKAIVKELYDSMNDDRQYITQTPTKSKEFYDRACEFLEEHKDKDAVFIALDHVMLLSGSDKQALLEELSEHINQLKLKFGNVYFILISQNNRSLLGRVAERNNNAAPNAGDVFGSSFLDQLCSWNIILYDAYRMGISEYMKVNPDRYEYLEKYFTDEDSNGKVSFNTEGLIFVHMIKTRESDTPYSNIFVIEKDGKKPEVDKPKEKGLSGMAAPIFNKPSEVKPNFDLQAAFGSPEELEEDNDAPF